MVFEQSISQFLLEILASETGYFSVFLEPSLFASFLMTRVAGVSNTFSHAENFDLTDFKRQCPSYLYASTLHNVF